MGFENVHMRLAMHGYIGVGSKSLIERRFLNTNSIIRKNISGLECKAHHFLEKVVIVTSLQTLSILAFSIGRQKLESRAFADTRKDSPYNNSFSRKTTGSRSLITTFSNPWASSDEYGDNAFNPE